jgi:uncharacterized membrane protein
MPTRDGPIYFKAVPRPNPPLAPVACICLLTAVAAIDALLALIFVIRGAWPVTPFMGVDVLLLAWAFFSSSRAARAREELSLSRSELCVDYFPPAGNPKHVNFNPYWVRVQLDGIGQGRSAITLSSHGRRLQMGSFLSPRNRVSVASELTAAPGVVRQTL